MEISIDTVVSIASLFVGGGGGAFFTWRWQRAKAKAEAEQAETTAAKEMQDMYQQMLHDQKGYNDDQRKHYDEQKQYIEELKEDRRHLREERNELRQRIDDTDGKVRELQQAVERNNSLLAWMRPMLCGKRECTDRIAVTSDDMAVATKKRGGRQHADKD